MPMVRCNAMAWTDEMEDGGALLRMLVTRHDPVAGRTVLTEEETMQRAPLTGTAAEKRYIERKLCERLWQAMLRVQMRKNRQAMRTVERAAKRQCKKDERQMKALLAEARDWRAHTVDLSSVESVTRRAALVKECLQEARALARSKGETLPWLECLPSGIRASKRLAPFVKRWAQRAARKAVGGECMVEREDKNDMSTDDDEDAVDEDAV